MLQLNLSIAYAQDTTTIKEKLTVLTEDVPGLQEKINVNVGKSTIQTFLTAIGKTHNLNITVDPSLDIPISASFSSETVDNVILYLIDQYDLELKITGTILSFTKKKEAIEIRTVNVYYNKPKNLLSYDLKGDNILEVTKKITELSERNIVVNPSLNGKLLTGFINDLPLASALEKLAIANNIGLDTLEDGTFLFGAKKQTTVSPSNNNPSNTNNSNKPTPLNTKDIELLISKDVNGENLISVSAIDKSISDIIKYIFNETGLNYIFFAEPNENTTLAVENMTLEELMSYMLNATDYTYKNHGNIYSFGLRDNEKLRNTKVVQLQYRSITDILGVIPREIKEGVTIQEFPELNSLILSGSAPNILEIENLVVELDQPVPVVTIELIIVDVSKTHEVKTGIEAGIAPEGVTSGGTILPGVDFTLSSGSLNALLGTIGLSNLGRLVPNFYVSLSALEANGNINIRSTPRLATLNSHEATFNIGETSYYLEQQQNVIGSQNPQTVITNQYKSVNADFSITIKPIVSGDEQVTLEVEVNQSTFTGRIAPDAPPGQASRTFQSMIRVKNEEMIVLGGLERDENSQSGSGLPGLSRVPFFKWLFGKRQKKKEKSQLLIFIKPSITY